MNKKLNHNWQEQNGVIYFSVTSDGTTGPEWIERLEKEGFRVGDYAKDLLRSDDFKPTSGVTTEVAVLKGMLFSDNDRITNKIRAEADKRKLTEPNAEVACLIREMFTDEEIEAMGLIWIVAMHEPIKDSDGDLNLLNVYRLDEGHGLHAFCGRPDDGWDRDSGFAFAVSKNTKRVCNAQNKTKAKQRMTNQQTNKRNKKGKTKRKFFIKKAFVPSCPIYFFLSEKDTIESATVTLKFNGSLDFISLAKLKK